LVIAGGFICQGCYAATGLRQDTTSVESKVVASKTVPVELDAPRDVAIRADGGRLTFQVDDLRQCRADVVETHANRETTARTLPSSFWWAAGSAVAVVGAGAALWGVGAEKVSEGQSIRLGDPDHERSLDRGVQMTIAGQVAVAVGGLVLSSSVIDLWLAGDESRDFSTTTTTKGTGHECRRQAAPSIELTARVGGIEASVRTDLTGAATVNLASPAFSSAGFVEPLGTAACTGCKSAEIALSPEELKNLILPRKMPEELQAWLSKHSDDPSAPEVQAALAESLQAETERLAVESRAAMSSGNLADAREKANRCLFLLPESATCRQAADAVTRGEADAALALGRKEAKAKNFAAATTAATECLKLIPDYAPCKALARTAELGAAAEAQRGEAAGAAEEALDDLGKAAEVAALKRALDSRGLAYNYAQLAQGINFMVARGCERRAEFLTEYSWKDWTTAATDFCKSNWPESWPEEGVGDPPSPQVCLGFALSGNCSGGGGQPGGGRPKSGW
jgi:tetratricopeptide (TPR) repeat protein